MSGRSRARKAYERQADESLAAALARASAEAACRAALSGGDADSVAAAAADAMAAALNAATPELGDGSVAGAAEIASAIAVGVGTAFDDRPTGGSVGVSAWEDDARAESIDRVGGTEPDLERADVALAERLGQGLLLFDADDRLTLWNARYAALFPTAQPLLRLGTPYRALIEAELDRAGGGETEATRTDERLRRHGAAEDFALERRISDKKWVRITETRGADGAVAVLYINVSDMRRREERIHHMAMHDSLTGLPNRAYFVRRLEEGLAAWRRDGKPCYVLLVDLDQFKAINDTHGHEAGDALLRAAGQRIRACVREVDTVARMGGDEFAVIAPDVRRRHEVEAVARRIVSVLAEPFDLDGRPVRVGASVGVSDGAVAPSDGEEALKRADLAMYHAKRAGRNTWRVYQGGMDTEAAAQRGVVDGLRDGLRAGAFELRYQPLVEADGAKLLGFEALLRWRRGRDDVLEPDAFLEEAESSGLILPIGEWALRRACADAAGWPDDLKVAVNMASAQLRHPKALETIDAALADSGLPPHRLDVEISETLLAHGAERALETLAALRARGVGVVLDEFGVSYRLVSALRAAPFDRIKIDRGFVADLSEEGETDPIVRAVARLGATMGVEVAAEGIETEAQRERVVSEGCGQIQGWLTGRPVAASEIASLIRRFRKRRSGPRR